ncbi:GNAT family N-acetyltransferase [Sphingomonas rhizophila]|uniref:GNAT family N-acetyltransferase n=1 Tax=Sphingomonas rhizophila TaxID=2071607 RepID=A0A7G9SBG0_9SPHN|nr:GNAT family N-acetyltransferase [Sphingomonas rhizophila]QNN65185.1 GNAT family N-acetyltransferase [Sphingomonas rhizophila]
MTEEADALAEAARNRGLKLVRSRVRTPGKRAFGKFALQDSKGTTVLGNGKHPSASADEVREYLRQQESSDWSESLGLASVPKAKRKAAPKPPPDPLRPEVRDAKAADADAMVALMKLLDHNVSAAGVRKRLKSVAAPTLVATLGKDIVGLCGLDMTTHIHRDYPVGRIAILVVTEDQRGSGLGRMLVEEAEKRLRRAGCKLIEITSNKRHLDAHKFYTALGYDQPSLRFAKHF